VPGRKKVMYSPRLVDMNEMAPINASSFIHITIKPR